MPRQSTTLRANALSMRYGRLVLFRDISFEVAPGAPLAITGANGSGKSTLLKILAGVLTPVRGDVELVVDGERVPSAGVPRAVGFVAPYLQLYEPFAARENLSFLARARGLSDRNGRIEAVLDRVGLLERADDPVSRFSTGMRQRLRIAAALLHEPPVLLLDEPSATLDDAGRSLAASLIGLSGKVVVVATNDPVEAGFCEARLDLDAIR